MKTFTKTYLYPTLLILLALFFLISGYLEITKNPATYLKTLKMGYPPYFILWLGISKIFGAAALAQPYFHRLKEWAFAGFTFDVTFAFISGLAIDSYDDCAKSIFVLCMIVWAYSLFLRKYKAKEHPGHYPMVSNETDRS